MASRPAPTKRTSAAAPVDPAAKPTCNIHESAIVASTASIMGTHTVELGEHTVLHPMARITAETGNVFIGRSSVICETAIVGGEGDMHIGDRVVIESGAIVEAKSIGDGTVIKSKTKIGNGATIGKHCTITALNEIKPNEDIPDYTVIYGNNQRRSNKAVASNREVREAQEKAHKLHVDLLKRIPDSSARYA